MALHFKNKQHEEAFKAFIDEAYLDIAEVQKLQGQERRQFAFLYLIAMYQEDYEAYEGERFYIEALDEISLGGPTYLIEENIGEMIRPHEQILKYAKALLKGEENTIIEASEIDQKWIDEVLDWMHSEDQL